MLNNDNIFAVKLEKWEWCSFTKRSKTPFLNTCILQRKMTKDQPKNGRTHCGCSAKTTSHILAQSSVFESLYLARLTEQ